MTNKDIFDEIIDKYRGTNYEMSDEHFNWLDENGWIEAFDSEIYMCSKCGEWIPVND
jgi:hypothetical protein